MAATKSTKAYFTGKKFHVFKCIFSPVKTYDKPCRWNVGTSKQV